MPSATAKPVVAIGAGIAGLSTARILAQSGHQVVVSEQSSIDRTQGYGITVREWAFQPLLSDLGSISTAEFMANVAVDRGVGGFGWIDLTLRDNSTNVVLMAPDPAKPGESDPPLFRASRSALRDWLSNGVDLRYEHRLISVEGEPGNLLLRFENGFETTASMVVAADGLHSTVRKLFFPHLKPAVLPVVVYHGDLYLTREEFDTQLAPHFGQTNVLGGVGDGFNTPLTIATSDEKGVFMDWTYSRAIKSGQKDTLWQPERGAKAPVPTDLIAELESKSLAPPFSTVINTKRIQESEVHNWLSRTAFIPRFNLDKGADKGIVFIGDAAHAMPIFGGEGGNHAMLDGVELARLISADPNADVLTSASVAEITQKFYDGGYQRGQEAVKRCRQRFGLLHRPIKQWKDLAKMAATRKAEGAKAQGHEAV